MYIHATVLLVRLSFNKSMQLRLIITAIIISLAFNSCKKDTYMTDAVITGWDYRLCVCCGGLFIELNDGMKYQIDNVADLGINNNDTFPILVKVDWVKLLKCNGNYISITRFKRL